MPIIRPVSALRNSYLEMARIARETKQPIFLTKNGTGDMVLLPIEEYDKRMAQLELYEKLAEGEADIKAGNTKTLAEASALMKEKITEIEVNNV